MPTLLLACLIVITTGSFALAQEPPGSPDTTAPRDEWPRTRPERTDHAETSTLADVNTFLEQLTALGAPIARSVLGLSERDREIPLVVCASPMVADGAEARASGRLVIYLQANIHGGEIEGKEAVLMLLREIATGEHPQWLARCVFVCTPIYNVDGNEAWGDGLEHRSHQNGPARVGKRANGSGLDLNRDCQKAETPEMRAALTEIYRKWDPHVVLDLHTTNGTRHGYTLTYAPPLHPDTDPRVLALARDTILPAARARMKKEWGEETNDYGNVDERDGTRGWFTFSPLGRYVSNYVGLRNRIGILVEATSYLPLETRITSTLRFMTTVIDLSTAEAGAIAAACRDADRDALEGKLPLLSTSFVVASRGEEPVPLEKEGSGRAPHEAPGPLISETLPIHDRFTSKSTREAPRAYWVPAAESRILSLLRRHGATVEPFRPETSDAPPVAIERFHLESVSLAARAFQGHRAVRVRGVWQEGEMSAEEASAGYLVPMRQPLARLIFHLLEPDLEDGAIAWEFAEGELEEGKLAPILRLR